MGFTQSELKDIIAKSLDQSQIVPTGHRGAFVTYLDDAGVRTAVAVRTMNGWEISGNLGWHTQDHGLDYGVNIMKTW